MKQPWVRSLLITAYFLPHNGGHALHFTWISSSSWTTPSPSKRRKIIRKLALSWAEHEAPSRILYVVAQASGNFMYFLRQIFQVKCCRIRLLVWFVYSIKIWWHRMESALNTQQPELITRQSSGKPQAAALSFRLWHPLLFRMRSLPLQFSWNDMSW